MNLWARYDEEDSDFIHFSAQVGTARPIRRLVASVHIDDLELFFGEENAKELRDRLEHETKVFCWAGLAFCRGD